MGNRWGNSGNIEIIYFGGLQNPCRWWLQPWSEKILAPWKKSCDQLRQHIQKQRHYFANKGLSSVGYGFSSSHVWMGELDYEESWMPKNWCFWNAVLEKTLESPLDWREIKPVHPKWNSPEYSLKGLMLKLKLQHFGHLMWRTNLLEKTLIAGKDWRWEEKGMTEDEMVGWHHQLDGHEFEQAPGVDDGQGSLACCSPWGHKELDMTKWLNWTECIKCFKESCPLWFSALS